MAINPQQTFASHILQKVVPSLQGNTWVTTYVANLEANSKRFLGEVPGEAIDARTYGERTKADLAAIAAALGSNASADVTSCLAGVEERFGLSAAAAPTAEAAAQAAGGITVTFDINAVLAAKADAAGEALDWKRSVVDLLKLFGKDSSVSARKSYMSALGLDAGTAGSAEGNEALRTALLKSVAANGGNLPSNIA
jgi:Domain of unknown function (DUF3597)